MEQGMLRGIAIVRVVALVVTVAVVADQRSYLVHPVVAWGLLGVAAAFTALTSWLAVERPHVLVRPPLVLFELALGAALLLADGLVFASGHIGSTQGGLAGSWPVAGVLTAGVALGPWLGLLGGAVLGIAHFAAAPLNGEPVASLSASSKLGFASSFVLYAMIGFAAGLAVRLVRRYDDQMAWVQAREEVSRTLHDGVLQTLALIARRSDDAQLASLAREQERELRVFISSTPPAGRAGGHRVPSTELLARLRSSAERASGLETSVVVANDVPPVSASRADALVGAASEAIANVAKHADASRLTVYVEPAGRAVVFCSIKDDGVGFDVAAPTAGTGLARSIRARVEAEGGRAEVSSTPGAGTEVRLWV